MKYDPDQRRIPVHLHFSRLIAKEAQERQEWIIVQRDYLVAIGNLVEQIAVATSVELQIVPNWSGSTIALHHVIQPDEAPGATLHAMQMLDTYCNQQLLYEPKKNRGFEHRTWTALGHLPANLGCNAFYIEILDPSQKLTDLIKERTAKEARP